MTSHIYLLSQHLSELSKGQVLELVSLCKRVAERLSNSLDGNSVNVRFTCPDKAFIKGYEPIVEQIAYNLMDNAIRYGGGNVEVAITDSTDNVSLSVSDDGPGIPEELRERVFERFYRIDQSRSRETGGTGLGLAIVKHAVETMSGSIIVKDSDLGGSSFVVTFPKTVYC